MQYRVNSRTNASTSCKILVKIGPVTSEENKMEYVPRLGRNLTIVVHSVNCRSEKDFNIAISILAVNRQSFLYIS